MPSVLFVYSWRDKFFVRKLVEKLKSSGIDVLFEAGELRVGDSLLHRISGSLEKSDYLIAALSHNSAGAKWLRGELASATTRKLTLEDVPILPVLLDRCEIPAFLKGKLIADFTDADNAEAAISDLLRAIDPKYANRQTQESATKTSDTLSFCITDKFELEMFENIRISGVEKGRSKKPNPEDNAYYVYFCLSELPPREWIEIFEAERKFPRIENWREAWIEEQFIVIYCSPEDVRMQLEDLKEDVFNTNMKYREHLKQEKDKLSRGQMKPEVRDEELNQFLEGLDC